MTIAFFILITLLITAYSLAPLLRPEEKWLEVVEVGTARQTLEAEKELYLRAIKDIEFEHASNKINDEDYTELRKHYGVKAARVIHDLEQLPDDELPSPEDTLSMAKISHQDRGALEAQIAEIKEMLNTLENNWEIGEINDDQYFIQYDDRTKELADLVGELKELLLDHPDKLQQKDD